MICCYVASSVIAVSDCCL